MKDSSDKPVSPNKPEPDDDSAYMGLADYDSPPDFEFYRHFNKPDDSDDTPPSG